MNVGIDASRGFQQNPTGTENYSYQLIKALAKIDTINEYTLYAKGGLTLANVGIDLPNTWHIHPIKYAKFWTQIGLGLQTWLDRLDLLFIPAHVIPFLKRINLPTVVTVHDIRTEFLPQHESLIQKIYLNRFTEQLRSWYATRIIAVSESTKNDLINRLNVPAEKITVIYEGVDLNHFNLNKRKEKERLERTTEKYGIKAPYILFVGTVQPRKNLSRLIQAFSLICSKYPALDLIIAGKKGWLAEEIYQLPDKLKISSKVKFIDYVDYVDLPYLYAGAELFAFPSLYEGFGLPILESLAMGTKVLTANISSMPEVGGDLAVYTSPENPQEIAEGLARGLDGKLDLVEAEAWVKKFSWQEAARKTLAVFDDVLHNQLK
jgi:glycosyltransferase involved in cell wall biosynthesis